MNHFSNSCTECAKSFLQILNGNLSFFSAISTATPRDYFHFHSIMCCACSILGRSLKVNLCYTEYRQWMTSNHKSLLLTVMLYMTLMNQSAVIRPVVTQVKQNSHQHNWHWLAFYFEVVHCSAICYLFIIVIISIIVIIIIIDFYLI